MHKENVKYVDTRALLDAKRREYEYAQKQASQGVDRAIEMVVWLVVFGVLVTASALLVAAQEGIW